jgi:hypothetical protein
MNKRIFTGLAAALIFSIALAACTRAEAQTAHYNAQMEKLLKQITEAVEQGDIAQMAKAARDAANLSKEAQAQGVKVDADEPALLESVAEAAEKMEALYARLETTSDPAQVIPIIREIRKWITEYQELLAKIGVKVDTNEQRALLESLAALLEKTEALYARLETTGDPAQSISIIREAMKLQTEYQELLAKMGVNIDLSKNLEEMKSLAVLLEKMVALSARLETTSDLAQGIPIIQETMKLLTEYQELTAKMGMNVDLSELEELKALAGFLGLETY